MGLGCCGVRYGGFFFLHWFLSESVDSYFPLGYIL